MQKIIWRLLLLPLAYGFIHGSVYALETTPAASNTESTVNFEHTESITDWGWVKRAPSNVKELGLQIIAPENRLGLYAVLGSTLVLIHYDQAITDEFQRIGRRMGLLSDTVTGREVIGTPLFTIRGQEVPLQIPTNTVGWMYYIGDGIVQIPITAGFWIYGNSQKDARALSTSTQLAEAMLTTGIWIQILKRSFGRESPIEATEPGGKWRPFPSFNEYNSHIPKYDAMPSGHLATVMASTTVIAGNYPDNKAIWPVGITAMSLLGTGMLMNGVHWAGDYPIGLAVGYLAGKIVLANAQRREQSTRVSMDRGLILPLVTNNGWGITYFKNF